MSRFGHFNGDNVDDFAIGASSYKIGGVSVGRVVVILGKSGFGSITLPDTTNAITIDGDASLGAPLFGSRVTGLGRFYAGTGNTLVASAPGQANTSSSKGAVYAFRGQSVVGGVLTIAQADASFAGPAANTNLGSVLVPLGPLSGLPAVATGNPLDTATVPGTTGSAFLFTGDATAGPFAKDIILSDPNAARNGQVVIGGAVPGRTA